MTPPTGLKAKAHDLLNAIKTLEAVETEHRPATDAERASLRRFGGFGPVALHIFPDPQTGKYKDGWQAEGDELKALLTSDEYASAKRTTFSQFFTAPAVMGAIHTAIKQLGVPAGATVLEPGCGNGAFMTGDHRYIGVELDGVTGRIARLLHPQADIRIQGIQDAKLPAVDAVIGNVPFADVRYEWQGAKHSLHDYCLVKSLSSLKPGGVLACVTSHFTLDKQNVTAREAMGAQADFLGAIRLPSTAFKAEGTEVVTDVVFFRKREPGAEPTHADGWLETGPLNVEDATVAVNRYFLRHPEMVLGAWSRKDTLYGTEGFSVTATGDLATQLRVAVGKLPRFEPLKVEAQSNRPPPKDGDRAHPQEPSETNGLASTNSRENASTAHPPFVPPPPLKHIAEGSFFVGDDKVIRQIENGTPEPVTYSGVLLKADGTPQARRIGSLIELRDLARRVLQSQNEGWPAFARESARADLNRAYDRFVAQHGPVNKTTVTQTAADGQVRRMPNLVKFREDPDAMLVMSLEEYDEAAGTAKKAAILRQDVVGPKPPVTSVATAEDGLLVSLDQRGKVDLPFIARLYGKPEAEVTRELGELIFENPATHEWQTADEYLSGNVRQKLAQAKAAGDVRNSAALEAVQPEDVLPGDIEANLGVSWLPPADIQAFAAELFGVPKEAVKTDYLKQDAVWCLEADYRAQSSVAATTDYGTSRVNGTNLLELALNQKSPVVYDPVPGTDQRVMNPTETLAAEQKQEAIKERFKAWVFADPDRTERLVRTYNDTFNSTRLRQFDGSHLQFPGMSKAVTLRPHQVDAVWRCMTGGNTLLAHSVGGGKTNICVAAAMKMKQAGLVKRPIVVCPNHMLEQFAREWLHLYPNAKILVASKEDFTRERRKLLTAKIATGDWDGVIVTHSSFERIGMSPDFQAQFLRDEIAEYEEMILKSKAAGGRNILKTLEKQKASREEKLKQLLAKDKKDSGLVFEDLGIDQLFIDEVQHYKNAALATKMDRVAGIQTAGSERAFDLMMKAAYLDRQHKGRGLVGASGTPVSNTMTELYTMQRYFDPHTLNSCGVGHFDAWAASFGNVVSAMEISPDGKTLKPRKRFAQFVNLPELVQMFRGFADVQTADMLDLPRPKLAGGKPVTVSCEMSEEQVDKQAKLVERYERIRSQKVDPREDNALAITTDGRKLALDPRLVGGTEDFPGSKVNACVRKVTQIWRETAANRSTQMIFCDMGVNPNPFSVYDDLVRKLQAQGIPKHEIAVMGDADTDAKKQSLFEKVRQGVVRIILGSTAKMGTGTNVQKRLVALHHLDAPWKPAEVEQREGRILRQGNTNDEVQIYRYVTEGSFDAYMWQALETKAKFIAQVMRGDCGVRKADDIGEQQLSYAEVKAIASGNPAVLTLAETDAELQRVAILRKNHLDGQYLARRSVRELPDKVRHLATRIERLEQDKATLGRYQSIVMGNQAVNTQTVLERITARLDRLPTSVSETRTVPLGTYHGLAFGLMLLPHGGMDAYLDGQVTRRTELRDNAGARAVLNAVERIAVGYGVEIERCEQDRAVAEGQLADFQNRMGAVFPHAGYERELTALRDRLKAALSEKEPKEGEPTAAELDAQIKTLRAANAVQETAARVQPKPVPTRRVRPVPEQPAVAQEPQPQAEVIPLPVPEPTPEQEPAEEPKQWEARYKNGMGVGRQLSLF